MEPTCWMLTILINWLHKRIIMEEKSMENAALEALVAINGDKQENHDILLLVLSGNLDPLIRLCEDSHNGKIEYYLLRWNDNTQTFVEYIKGDSVPEIPPVGWEKIQYRYSN